MKELRGAVLGSPISHSLSPILHNTAYKLLGISGEYTAIEVESGDLSRFLKERGNEFDYFSLTMPLKEEALSLGLDFDFQVDELGERIQSLNTLIRRDQKWFGTSTDGSGFKKALAHRGFDHSNRALILGAGGTARAVAGALDGMAISVDVMGRSVRRNVGIANCFRNLDPTFLVWSDTQDLTQYDLVINTTPSGAVDLLSESVQQINGKLFFDVLYKPWPTLIAQRWSDHGGAVIGGIDLLLYQGIDQINLLSPIGSKFIDQELRDTLVSAIS